MDIDVLISRFDAALPAQWEPHVGPTEESIAAIEAHFAFTVPEPLIAFARQSRSFSSFFLGLGTDYAHHSHIIQKNTVIRSDQYWLRQGLVLPAPKNLVFITENFMEDYFWCLDIACARPEYPVVFWSPDGRQIGGYANFGSFILDQISYYEGLMRK